MTARLAGTLIVIALIFGAGYTFGAAVHKNRLLEAVQAQDEALDVMRAKVRKIEGINVELTKAIASRTAEVITEIQVVEREIEKEVIRYVPDPGSSNCPDDEWLRIYTRITTKPGMSPPTDTTDAGDAARPGPREVLLNAKTNGALYWQCQEKHRSLVEWIETMALR